MNKKLFMSILILALLLIGGFSIATAAEETWTLEDETLFYGETEYEPVFLNDRGVVEDEIQLGESYEFHLNFALVDEYETPASAAATAAFFDTFEISLAMGKNELEIDKQINFPLNAGESRHITLTAAYGKEEYENDWTFAVYTPENVQLSTDENGDIATPRAEWEEGDVRIYPLILTEDFHISDIEVEDFVIRFTEKNERDWAVLVNSKGALVEDSIPAGSYYLMLEYHGEDPFNESVIINSTKLSDPDGWNTNFGRFIYNETAYEPTVSADPDDLYIEDRAFLNEDESHTWELYPVLFRFSDSEMADTGVRSGFNDRYTIQILVDDEEIEEDLDLCDPFEVTLNAGQKATVIMNIYDGNTRVWSDEFTLRAILPHRLTLENGILTLPVEELEFGDTQYYSFTIEEMSLISANAPEGLTAIYGWMDNEGEYYFKDFYNSDDGMLCGIISPGTYLLEVDNFFDEPLSSDATFTFSPMEEDSWYFDGDWLFWYNDRAYEVGFSADPEEDNLNSVYVCEDEDDSHKWTVYPVLFDEAKGEMAAPSVTESFLDYYEHFAEFDGRQIAANPDGSYTFSLDAGEHENFFLYIEIGDDFYSSFGQPFSTVIPTELLVADQAAQLAIDINGMHRGDSRYFIFSLTAPVKISTKEDYEIRIHLSDNGGDGWKSLYDRGDMDMSMIPAGDDYILCVENVGEDNLSGNFILDLSWEMGDWTYEDRNHSFWYEGTPYRIHFSDEPDELYFSNQVRFMEAGDETTWTMYPVLVDEEEWMIASDSVIESFFDQYDMAFYDERDRDNPLTPDKDGAYRVTLEAGEIRYLACRITENGSEITTYGHPLYAAIPEEIEIENDTLTLPIDGLTEEEPMFFTFTLDEAAAVSTEYDEMIYIELFRSEDSSTNFYEEGELYTTFLGAGTYFLQVENRNLTPLEEDMEITFNTDSSDWGWMFDSGNRTFLYEGETYSLSSSAKPDKNIGFNEVFLKQDESKEFTVWPIIVDDEREYVDLMDSFLENFDVVPTVNGREIPLNNDGSFTVTAEAGETLEIRLAVYKKDTNERLINFGDQIRTRLLEELSIVNNQVIFDIPTGTGNGRYFGYYTLTLEQDAAFVLKSAPANITRPFYLERQTEEGYWMVEYDSNMFTVQPMILKAGTHIFRIDTEQEFDKGAQLIFNRVSAITDETFDLSDTDYEDQGIWPGNGAVELTIDGVDYTIDWYRRADDGYLNNHGRNNMAMNPDDSNSESLFPAVITIDEQGNRVEMTDLQDEFEVTKFVMLRRTEGMTAPDWYEFTDVNGWVGRSFTYDLENIGEWWMIAHVTFMGEEVITACGINITENRNYSYTFDDIDELNDFLYTLSGEYYVEQWCEEYEEEHGVAPTPSTPGYPTEQVLRDIALGFVFDGTDRITYDITLEAGEYLGLIEVPGDLLYEFSLYGEMINGENATQITGGIHCNGRAYNTFMSSVYNIDFIGAGKDREEWNADAPKPLKKTPNMAFYGYGGGGYNNCTFTGYWHAVDCDNEVIRFGGSGSKFMDNHIAIYCHANDDNGGRLTISHNHFEDNDCAILISRLYFHDDANIGLTPKDYRIHDNTFVDNGYSLLNYSGRILYAHGNLFTVNGKATVYPQWMSAPTDMLQELSDGDYTESPISIGLMKDENGYFIADDADSILLPDGGTAEYLFTTEMIEDKDFSIEIMKEVEEDGKKKDKSKGKWHFNQKHNKALSSPYLLTGVLKEEEVEVNGWDAGIALSETETTVTVTVNDDDLLREFAPTLELSIPFEACTVTDPSGDPMESTVEDGSVFFTVTEGGSYVITKEIAEPDLTVPTESEEEGEAFTFRVQGAEPTMKLMICAYDANGRMISMDVRIAVSGKHTAYEVDGAVEYKVFLLDANMAPVCDNMLFE